MNQAIGFVGLGNMGQPMALNILKTSSQLRIYNRTPKKAEPLVAQGAQAVGSSAEAVESGGIVITMLANDAAVEEVVHSKDFLERLKPGGIHLSMSTISPYTARKLAALHAKTGSFYVAAPVLGRPDQAAARKLTIYVAGPPAAKERVQPILHALGQNVFDLGEDPGAANVAKLCSNFLIVSAIEAMSEALTLAEKQGMERSTLMNILAQTSFNCPIYQNYGKIIAEKDYAPGGFSFALGLKDVELIEEIAGEARAPVPLADLARDRFLAGLAKGRANLDWSAISLGALEDAGLPLPPSLHG